MHQILCTSDHLNEIFSYLSRHTCTVAARVCRLWFTHSIQSIWDTVSVNDTLRVLSPFDDDGFKQPLLPESWHRFFLYSKNIRQLKCHEIQHAALRQALLWRPNVDLLSSKLTLLKWDAPSEYIEYLPSLVTLTLQILQLELDTIKNTNTLDIFCKTIPLHSPSLRALEVSFPPADNDTQAISRSLGELFSLLSELVLIRLPPHCMTGELFTTLSRLHQLQALSLSQYSYSLYMDENIMEMLSKRRFDDDKESGKGIPFHSLEKLDIFDSDFMMVEALRRGLQLLKLADLTYLGTPDHTITSIESLHRTCPNIEKISIFADSLPFQAIRSLLKCPALVEIVLNSIVDADLEDIVTIATNRSSWKSITLPSVKPVSYHALIPFARNCPHLYKLNLTLDSTLGIPDPSALDVKFSSLTSLEGGLESPDFELAFFLSKIFSKPIEIIGYRSSWKTLEKLVNFIITTEIKNRTLEDENMLLRTQKCNHNF
ncbi:hypothetical protein Clacol_002131 [Clathrus columnatus]|uniref:F-box domain-containing protein n=1 Tax=Clathrus columnatus TaxID=1419009 RepID=A0AAV5A3U2_9AGAM|nr:hypothetical protein Clacol_002131 [Clathrus columnatus]